MSEHGKSVNEQIQDNYRDDHSPFVRQLAAMRDKTIEAKKTIADMTTADKLEYIKNADHNDPTQISVLKELAKDQDLDIKVKYELVELNIKEIDQILAYDKNFEIRWELAIRGGDDILDVLVNDPNKGILEQVALWGRPQDLEKLVNNSHPHVSTTAKAISGNAELLDPLVNELISPDYKGNPHLREDLLWRIAKYSPREEDLDKLSANENMWIVKTVINRGIPNIIKQCENDDRKEIREYVKVYKKDNPDWDKKQPDREKETVSKED